MWRARRSVLLHASKPLLLFRALLNSSLCPASCLSAAEEAVAPEEGVADGPPRSPRTGSALEGLLQALGVNVDSSVARNAARNFRRALRDAVLHSLGGDLDEESSISSGTCSGPPARVQEASSQESHSMRHD